MQYNLLIRWFSLRPILKEIIIKADEEIVHYLSFAILAGSGIVFLIIFIVECNLLF